MAFDQALVSELTTRYQSDKHELWRQLCDKVLTPRIPIEEHFKLHRQVWGSDSYPVSILPGHDFSSTAPVWVPNPEAACRTNLSGYQVKRGYKAGAEGYDQLFKWAAEPASRDEFWNDTKKALHVNYKNQKTQTMNIVDSCFTAPKDHIACKTDNGKVLTYGEFKKLVDKFSNAIVAMGCVKGDVLGYVMPMTIHTVALYLGIVQAGCIAVTVAESFSAPEIAVRMRIAKAKAIFVQDSFKRGNKSISLYDRLEKAHALCSETVKSLWVLRDRSMPYYDLSSLKAGDRDFDEVFEKSSDSFTSVPCKPSDFTHILFSSGTTGEPKAIPWSHETPIKCGSDAYYHMDIKPESVCAWPTSMGWMMGPCVVYMALLNRASFAVSTSIPTSPSFFKFVQDAKITFLGLVPALCKAWRNAIRLNPAAHESLIEGFRTVQLFGSTGEASTPEDYFWLMSRVQGYAPVMEYCGGTEIGGGFLSGCLLQPQVASAFSTPCLGLDVILLDAKEEVMEGAGEGQLTLLPPSVGLSTTLLNRDHEKVYFAGMPKFKGQRLRRHGDRMRRLGGLAPGYMRAGGRMDDTMNLGGIKVSSVELERCCNEADELMECAAVGVPPLAGGADQLIVYAVVKSGVETTEEALCKVLNANVREHLNPLFRVKEVVMIGQLPRTASNKVMHRVLRDWYVKSMNLQQENIDKGVPSAAWIVSMARTPFGVQNGKFAKKSAVDLGVLALKGAIAKCKASPALVEQCIMGNVCGANQGQNPARQVALGAGCNKTTPGLTVNKVCASGMVSVALGAQAIRLGQSELVACGGMESMTSVPWYLPHRMPSTLVVSPKMTSGLMRDGLMDAGSGTSMGVFAEKCVKDHGLTRQGQDEFSIGSFAKAKQDADACRAEELVVVPDMPDFVVDEGIAKGNPEKLVKLRPAFVRDGTGTVTAGNASQVSDGACALLLADPVFATKHGLSPIAKIVRCMDAARDPEDFTVAPAAAMLKLLAKERMSVNDVDYFEINEAFSCVPLANMKLCSIPTEKTNIYGGAVARGHPLGASGTRIIMALVRALRENSAKRGLAGICNGGGGASAMLIERM